MSSGHHATSDPTSNLHTILKEATMQYKALTGEDLAMHPYAAQLENWNSVDAVLGIFQTQAQEFEEFRRGNNKLLTRLHPLVQTLVIVSGSLGDTLGGVNIKDSFFSHHCALIKISQSFPPAKGIFTGISILLMVGLFLNVAACELVTLDSSRPQRVSSQATTYSSTSSSVFSFSYNASRSIPVSNSQPN
jgi:hypothetical protein